MSSSPIGKTAAVLLSPLNTIPPNTPATNSPMPRPQHAAIAVARSTDAYCGNTPNALHALPARAPQPSGGSSVPAPALGSAEFNRQPAAAKLQQLWRQIEHTEYAAGALPGWTGREALSLFARALDPFRRCTQSAHMAVTLEHESDIMPQGRRKAIHTYGCVAPVRFDADPNSRYSGLFESSAPCGLIRLSLAKKPGKTNSVPGMAVKLFVDGQPSVNFMAMHSLDGQPSHDFFANNFSNFIEPPRGFVLKRLASLFKLAASDPTKVSVAHLAAVTDKGARVEDPIAPGKLVFKPSRAVSGRFSVAQHEVRGDFKSITAGTKLYDVFAVQADGSETPVGSLTTTDRFVASEMGDKQLFFRHEEVGA